MIPVNSLACFLVTPPPIGVAGLEINSLACFLVTPPLLKSGKVVEVGVNLLPELELELVGVSGKTKL